MMPSCSRCFASWSRAGAGAVLDDSVVFPRRRDDLLRFEHVVRAGLLDEDVLAGLEAQIVCSVWWKLGVAIDTASMLRSSSSLRMSVNVAGRFLPAASTILQPLSTTASSTSQSAAISTLGIFR